MSAYRFMPPGRQPVAMFAYAVVSGSKRQSTPSFGIVRDEPSCASNAGVPIGVVRFVPARSARSWRRPAVRPRRPSSTRRVAWPNSASFEPVPVASLTPARPPGGTNGPNPDGNTPSASTSITPASAKPP